MRTLGFRVIFHLQYFSDIILFFFFSELANMSRQVFKTLDEAVEYLYSEEIEAAIVALPPEVDELTDEDDLNDDDLDVPVVSDVAGQTEINLPFDDEDDNNVPLSVFTRQGPSTSHQKEQSDFSSNGEEESAPKRSKKILLEKNVPKWKKTNPQFDIWENTNTPQEKFADMLPILSDASMLEIFEHFFFRNRCIRKS